MTTTSNKSVLVTDGNERAALAIARSLGRLGYRVIVCSSRRKSLAGASRYVTADVQVPDAVMDPDAFVQAIRRTIDQYQVNVLMPVSEASLLAILPERWPGVSLPMPSAESFRRISGKAELLRAAASLGLAIPMQRVADSRDQALAIADEELEYPIVLKPGRSVGETAGRRRKQLVQHVGSRSAFGPALAKLDDAAFPLLIQQRIRGPGVGVFLLVWEGRTIAHFCHRRIREKPPSGGVSVYRESIAPDVALIERSRALLDCFDWRGVAMVEYKVDAASGEPYVMEVNGRFWGSLQLAIDAGVDFPALLVAAVRGEHVDRVDSYRVGVRSRWWWGDVDHLIARFRSQDELLTDELPGRWRALLDFIKPRRGIDQEEVFRLDDPRPFFRETRRWFSGQ